MSSLKRKGAPGGPSAPKSSKTSSEPRPSKRTKSEKPAKQERKPASTEEKAPASKAEDAPVISRLKEEEPLFPRGGGSVLSPLEHKQIQIQAKKDVLFEQEAAVSAKQGEKIARRKSRKSTEKGPDLPVRDEDAVKIESLNYKVLSALLAPEGVLMLIKNHSVW